MRFEHFDIEELKRCGAWGTGKVKPSNLNIDVHKFFERRRWNVTDHEYNLLIPSLRLATYLLYAGVPYLSSYISNDIHESILKQSQEKESLYEWYCISMNLNNTQKEHQDTLRTLDALADRVTWEINYDMFTQPDLGWMGITNLMPQTKRWSQLDPARIRGHDEELKEKGETQRYLMVGIMGEYLKALHNSSKDSEENLRATFEAAVTITHEIAHCAWHYDFRSLDYNQGGYEPYFHQDAWAELGLSFIAYIFNGWKPELFPHDDPARVDKKEANIFKIPLVWEPHPNISRKRELFVSQYAINTSWLEMVQSKQFWDNADVKAFEFSQRARRKLKPKTDGAAERVVNEWEISLESKEIFWIDRFRDRRSVDTEPLNVLTQAEINAVEVEQLKKNDERQRRIANMMKARQGGSGQNPIAHNYTGGDVDDYEELSTPPRRVNVDDYEEMRDPKDGPEPPQVPPQPQRVPPWNRAPVNAAPFPSQPRRSSWQNNAPNNVPLVRRKIHDGLVDPDLPGSSGDYRIVEIRHKPLETELGTTGNAEYLQDPQVAEEEDRRNEEDLRALNFPGGLDGYPDERIHAFFRQEWDLPDWGGRKTWSIRIKRFMEEDRNGKVNRYGINRDATGDVKRTDGEGNELYSFGVWADLTTVGRLKERLYEVALLPSYCELRVWPIPEIEGQVHLADFELDDHTLLATIMDQKASHFKYLALDLYPRYPFPRFLDVTFHEEEEEEDGFISNAEGGRDEEAYEDWEDGFFFNPHEAEDWEVENLPLAPEARMYSSRARNHPQPDQPQSRSPRTSQAPPAQSQKRKPGRPKKIPVVDLVSSENSPPPKRKRGRPPKNPPSSPKPKRRPGRPRKSYAPLPAPVYVPRAQQQQEYLAQQAALSQANERQRLRRNRLDAVASGAANPSIRERIDSIARGNDDLRRAMEVGQGRVLDSDLRGKRTQSGLEMERGLLGVLPRVGMTRSGKRFREEGKGEGEGEEEQEQEDGRGSRPKYERRPLDRGNSDLDSGEDSDSESAEVYQPKPPGGSGMEDLYRRL